MHIAEIRVSNDVVWGVRKLLRRKGGGPYIGIAAVAGVDLLVVHHNAPQLLQRLREHTPCELKIPDHPPRTPRAPPA